MIGSTINLTVTSSWSSTRWSKTQFWCLTLSVVSVVFLILSTEALSTEVARHLSNLLVQFASFRHRSFLRTHFPTLRNPISTSISLLSNRTSQNHEPGWPGRPEVKLKRMTYEQQLFLKWCTVKISFTLLLHTLILRQIFGKYYAHNRIDHS